MRFSKLFLLPIGCWALIIIGYLAMPIEIFWYRILPIVGFVFLCSSFLIPYWWFKRVPEVARMFEMASRNKMIPAIIAHDTGRAALTLLTEYLGEGIVKTLEGKFKILPHFAPMTRKKKKKNHPRIKEVQMPNGSSVPLDTEIGEEPEEDEQDVELFFKEYRDLTGKRTILTGFDRPIFFGYSGKACLLNPEALTLYEAGQMMIRTEDGSFSYLKPHNSEDIGSAEIWARDTERTTNPTNPKVPNLLQPLLLLEPRKIKDLIGRQFNPTQLQAVATESEQIGRFGRPNYGKFALPIIFFIILAIVGILMLTMGPSLTEQFTGGGKMALLPILFSAMFP